jgi:hypothetical protein
MYLLNFVPEIRRAPNCHPFGFIRKGINDVVIEQCVTALQYFNLKTNMDAQKLQESSNTGPPVLSTSIMTKKSAMLPLQHPSQDV